MRTRYRQINGELVEITPESVPRGTLIIEDIAPYHSMVTGELITSRSKHREHLKIHEVQEVGNEMPKFLKDKYERDGIRPKYGSDGRRIG